MKHFVTLLAFFVSTLCFGQTSTPKVVHVKLQEEIAPSASRLIQKAIDFASAENASLILIEMDTYGGLLIDADSIRQDILNQDIPIYVFINKNAGSAGALISIACDKIYMASGASIGSATVVNDKGVIHAFYYEGNGRKPWERHVGNSW
jgi:membrane-bound serine protease (ClpP class)